MFAAPRFFLSILQIERRPCKDPNSMFPGMVHCGMNHDDLWSLFKIEVG